MKIQLHGHWFRLGIAGALLALGACSGDSNLVRDAAVATGAGIEPRPGLDFVASSRPAELDYIQPGVESRPTKAKSAEDVKAFEAKMEEARATNESKAAAARKLGAKPGPDAPAGAPKP
jgi:hypothetical protein